MFSQSNSQQNSPMGSQSSPVKRPTQVSAENTKRLKTISYQDQIARRNVQNSNPTEIRTIVGIVNHITAFPSKSPSAVKKLSGIISVSDAEAKIFNSGGYVNFTPPPIIQHRAKELPHASYPRTSSNNRDKSPPLPTSGKEQQQPPSPTSQILVQQTNYFPYTPPKNHSEISTPVTVEQPINTTEVPKQEVYTSLPSPVKAPVKNNLPPMNNINNNNVAFKELEDLRKDTAQLKNRVHSLELENDKLNDEILLSQEQIAMSKRDANMAKEELDKKQQLIKELLHQNSQHTTLVESKQNEYSKLINKIELLEQQLHQKDITIESLRSEIKNREILTCTLQKENNLYIETLQRQSHQKDSVIESLQNTLNKTSSEKDKVIVDLRERIKGLDKQSTTMSYYKTTTESLQDEFMIDSYGSYDSALDQTKETKEAKIAELECRLLKTYQLLEKIKGLPWDHNV